MKNLKLSVIIMLAFLGAWCWISRPIQSAPPQEIELSNELEPIIITAPRYHNNER